MANPLLRTQVLRVMVEERGCGEFAGAAWCYGMPIEACRCAVATDRVMALVGDRVFSVAQAEALVEQAFREAGGIRG